MYNILLIVQILVAIGIIGLVLMQHGKGADAGAAFGGGGAAGGAASGSVFGARGAGNFLSRTTAILALAFFVNSMALAWLVSHRGDVATSNSIVDTVTAPVEKAIPVAETAPSDVPDAPDTATPVAQSAGEESDVPEAAATESSAGSASDVPEAEETPPASGEKAVSGDVPEAPTSKVDATVDTEAEPEKK